MSIFDKNGKFNPVGWTESEISDYCKEFFGDEDYYIKQQKPLKSKLILVVDN